MEIILNGEKTAIPTKENLLQYIKELSQQWEISLDGAVVLINDQIIKKDNWKNTLISDGDLLEVLSFVSGG